MIDDACKSRSPSARPPPSAAHMLLCTCKTMIRACGQPPHTTHTNEGRHVHPMAVASSKCTGESGRRLTHQQGRQPASPCCTDHGIPMYLSNISNATENATTCPKRTVPT